MTSTRRWSHEARERCNRHGLVVVHDGACLLCLRERSRLKWRGLFWTITGLVVLAVFLIPKWFAFAWHPSFIEENAMSRAPEEVVRAPNMKFDVDAARGRRGAPSADSEAKSPVSRSDSGPTNAEDRYLGAPAVKVPVAAVAPPTPPRARIEDAPLAHDNPADFDLPSARQ